jgi:hypothetical protein
LVTKECIKSISKVKEKRGTGPYFGAKLSGHKLMSHQLFFQAFLMMALNQEAAISLTSHTLIFIDE